MLSVIVFQNLKDLVFEFKFSLFLKLPCLLLHIASQVFCLRVLKLLYILLEVDVVIGKVHCDMLILNQLVFHSVCFRS